MFVGHNYIFGLIVLQGIFQNTNESRTRDNGHSLEEQFIYKSLQHDNLDWKWSGRPSCRVLCPRGMGVFHLATHIDTKEILLEAPGCVKFEVETLVCLCHSRRRGIVAQYAFRTDYYMNDLTGEIYPLKGGTKICVDCETLAIQGGIIGVHQVKNTERLPKLKGIARIFEARNIMRAEWRQWNRDHISGAISSSSEENGERRRLQLDELMRIPSDDLWLRETAHSETSDDDDHENVPYEGEFTLRRLRELLARQSSGTTGTTGTAGTTDDDDDDNFVFDLYVV